MTTYIDTTQSALAVDQQQACSALERWLKQEMAKSAALAAADNRKILWLAMQTEPWLNCPLMCVQADILAELESRMYPEYDGDTVKFTEWGWQTPEGEIRYLPNEKYLARRALDSE